ncbi:MAG: tyrosine decarboxylase MfnA [Promethearchaeota archaeon]
MSKQELLKILDKKLSIDDSYDSGYILGSMCSKTPDFVKDIYIKYLDKNLGDPGLFRGTRQLEIEVVNEIGQLFGSNNIVGTITTGGSESNIIAMLIAKKLRPDIKKPEIVISKACHISFDKAADMMGLIIRKANLNDNYDIDLKHFKSLINENTCAVIGVAGTTSLGKIDPIDKIGDYVKKKDVFFHVDAAYGGFVLPFLKNLNYKVNPWDFTIETVDSITADPHKMGLGPIPSGGLFLRNQPALKNIGVSMPYLAGGNFKHINIVGTRAGAPVIAFWSILRYFGMKYFNELVEKCMRNTKLLVDLISEIDGVTLATEPEMNIVGIKPIKGKTITELDKQLRKRKWMVATHPEFNIIRIVVMPHVQEEHLRYFAKDLKEILR